MKTQYYATCNILQCSLFMFYNSNNMIPCLLNIHFKWYYNIDLDNILLIKKIKLNVFN